MVRRESTMICPPRTEQLLLLAQPIIKITVFQITARGSAMMVMERAQRHDECSLKSFTLPKTNPVPFPSRRAVEKRSRLDVPSSLEYFLAFVARRAI
jgi:hypothetical protein